MAATIPTALRQADIARFAQRAGQLQKAKPVVAYWCNYWIVNQILSKGLHNSDDESMTYTMRLLDKLEQSKADHRDNDAIIDDLAGQAYVEQFGTETLSRAEKAMKLNKSTRQTVDTFLASAAFLELCQIWGPLDPEAASKIKYAKYHAVRIAQAIKAGEDPNLSNPAPMEPSAHLQASLELKSPDVQASNEFQEEEQDRGRSITYQPFVEDAPDEQDLLQPRLAGRSFADEFLHRSRASSSSQPPSQDTLSGYRPPATEETEHYAEKMVNSHNILGRTEVAPLEPSALDERGYFPRMPGTDGVDQTSPVSQEIAWKEADLPPPADRLNSSVTTASHTPTTSNSHLPETCPAVSLQSFPPPNMDRPPPLENAPPSLPSYPIKPSYMTSPPRLTKLPPSPQGDFRSPSTSVPPLNTLQMHHQVAYLADEEAVLKAQKHARWAISALNFEDVSTAVKELREALESLGAR